MCDKWRRKHTLCKTFKQPQLQLGGEIELVIRETLRPLEIRLYMSNAFYLNRESKISKAIKGRTLIVLTTTRGVQLQ